MARIRPSSAPWESDAGEQAPDGGEQGRDVVRGQGRVEAVLEAQALILDPGVAGNEPVMQGEADFLVGYGQVKDQPPAPGAGADHRRVASLEQQGDGVDALEGVEDLLIDLDLQLLQVGEEVALALEQLDQEAGVASLEPNAINLSKILIIIT